MSITYSKTRQSPSFHYGGDWDRSVFDTDRFRKRGSGNRVDWEDVSTGDCDTDGFGHSNYDENGEW